MRVFLEELPAHNRRLIIPAVPRRIHVPILGVGELLLDKREAHHARDVLRLPSGSPVDVFDDAGATASGILQHFANGDSAVQIAKLVPPSGITALQWTIAAAVPKGDRADWMVEKLSELGATAFIPLAAARSVVLPAGKNRWERWNRIATEAAKQSRRAGVMRIGELTAVETAVKEWTMAQSARQRREVAPSPVADAAWVLTTELPGAMSIGDAASNLKSICSLSMFIGPEGGWTNEELAAFADAGVRAVRLGASILRIETAAIAAAAVVSALAR